jgi:predicted RNA-binding Zn ribbon-like protein
MRTPRTFGWVNSDNETISVALCLDFANTVGDHSSQAPREYLNEFADLVRWCEEAELIKPRLARFILEKAKREPEQAFAMLAEAKKLREAIYRIFVNRLNGKAPAPADLQILNLSLKSMPLLFEVRIEDHRPVCHHESATTGLAPLIAPVAWSAADLLTSEKVLRVKTCGDETCGWLFLDTTKNHKRRWCDMSGCGCRAKAKTYYRRKKAAGD